MLYSRIYSEKIVCLPRFFSNMHCAANENHIVSIGLSGDSICICLAG